MTVVEVHWDFVQIQLNYVDWKHASGSNFKAEYLYDELAKRKIPGCHYGASAGWAALQCPRPYCGTAEAVRTRTQCGVLAFRCAGSPQDVLDSAGVA